MELTKLARVLCKLIALLMLVWIGYVVYCAITDTGIWKHVVDLIVTDSTGLYSPMGAFAISLLVGLLPLGAILFFIIWLSHKITSK
jgi:hypothetical protein